MLFNSCRNKNILSGSDTNHYLSRKLLTFLNENSLENKTKNTGNVVCPDSCQSHHVSFNLRVVANDKCLDFYKTSASKDSDSLLGSINLDSDTISDITSFCYPFGATSPIHYLIATGACDGSIKILALPKIVDSISGFKSRPMFTTKLPSIWCRSRSEPGLDNMIVKAISFSPSGAFLAYSRSNMVVIIKVPDEYSESHVILEPLCLSLLEPGSVASILWTNELEFVVYTTTANVYYHIIDHLNLTLKSVENETRAFRQDLFKTLSSVLKKDTNDNMAENDSEEQKNDIVDDGFLEFNVYYACTTLNGTHDGVVFGVRKPANPNHVASRLTCSDSIVMLRTIRNMDSDGFFASFSCFLENEFLVRNINPSFVFSDLLHFATSLEAMQFLEKIMNLLLAKCKFDMDDEKDWKEHLDFPVSQNLRLRVHQLLNYFIHTLPTRVKGGLNEQQKIELLEKKKLVNENISEIIQNHILIYTLLCMETDFLSTATRISLSDLDLKVYSYLIKSISLSNKLAIDTIKRITQACKETTLNPVFESEKFKMIFNMEAVADVEACVACEQPLPLVDRFQAICINKHKWPRCGITGQVIATIEPISKCSVCLMRSLVASTRVIGELYYYDDAILGPDYCLYCGEHVEAIHFPLKTASVFQSETS